MKQMLSLVFAILLADVVCGQRCKDDAEWEDMGPDGCINFMARSWTNSFSQAGIDCTSFEHAGRYAQLMRFRDSSQAAADASFDALYQKFYQYKNSMDDVAWVNIYQGADGPPSRSANMHGYDTWLKTTTPYTKQYTTYNYLPQNGGGLIRWKSLEPNSFTERCYELMFSGTVFNVGLNDESCSDQHYYPCQMYASCTSAERQVEFGCECDDSKAYSLNGVCTMCPHERATAGVCYCNGGSYRLTTGGVVSCIQCAAGKYAGGGVTECELCSAGSYMQQPGASQCNLCAAGTYSTGGATGCIDCAAGKTAQHVGSTSCLTCLAGTYAASATQACVSCEVGKYKADAALTLCAECDAGTYQDRRGKTTCIDCRVTEVSNKGAASCTACPPGEEYLDTSTASELDCRPCDNGYYADLETDKCVACEWNQRSQVPVGDACVPCDPWAAQDRDGISCTRCLAGQYYNRNIRTCVACAAGSYQEDFNIEPACTPCPSFTPWSGLNSRAWTNVATDAAGDEIGGTKASDCQCLPHLTAYEYEDVTLCLCGRGQFMRSENDSACELAARGVYQPSVHRTVNRTEALPYVYGGITLDLTDNEWSQWSEQLECPYGSTTEAEASETIDDCKCAGGQDSTALAPRTSLAWRDSSATPGQLLNQPSSDIAFALEPVTLPRFKCPCDVGEYLTPAGCELCKGCDGGEYRTDCAGLLEGTCVPCETCADVNGEKMMRVGCISREGRTDQGGECKPERVVVRTPLCPEDVEDVSGKVVYQTQLGLGGFSFVSAFSKDEEDVDFACSRECRGDDTGDQGQCDGPFACNVKTCLQQQGDYTVTRPLPPTMVCPVYMTAEESQDFWTYEAAVEAKRRERCVACSDCGHQNYEERVGLYDHWGAGCARECSLHLCPLKSNDIFDWTDGVCKACTELRDGRLCSASDAQRLRIQETGMTGNLPFLTFVGCGGRAEGFDHVQYGRCELCESVTCDADEFEASCHAPQCQKCDRSRTPAVAGLRQVWRSENGEEVPLYCQISACLEAGRTGVRDHGPVCEAECGETGLCGAEEVEIACLLPHDTRCESVWPPRTNSGSEAKQRVDVGDEVNLLNEPVETEERHRFASFENTLINLGATEHEYQCVWNAAGILDNSAKPGGVSAVLFAPGHAYAAEYRDRGTKACRQWRRLLDVEYPLLPLQNTIAVRTEATRRMAVNVEAHVVSYRYDGLGVDGTAALQQVGRLDGVHQGGVGDLFLVLDTRGARDAVVSVALPRDRNMANATWLRSVLVSFAVADVTRVDDTSDRPRATAYVKLQKAQGPDASDVDLSAERVARKVVSPWPSDHASYTLSASREAQRTLTQLTNFSGQWRTFGEAHWVGSSPLELKAGGAVDAYVLTDAARLRGAYPSGPDGQEPDAVLRALHVLGRHVSVDKHVSNARDRFELAGVQVNVDVALSGLRHAQLVPSGSHVSNACTLLAATALEVWCLRFARAEQYSANAVHMQHAMQTIIALPAGGVTRIVGVSSVALGGVDRVHLVLACERCLDAEAGTAKQVADADDRSGTLFWCRGNCTELVETECEHCSHFLSIAGFENPGNGEDPNTLLAVEFAAVTGGLVLRLGEYGVRNVSALRQEFGGVGSIFVSDVSVTPRMNVTELGAVKATELPWLRGCRVARQSYSAYSAYSAYSESSEVTTHILTVCAVRETAADGAQTLVLRAWLLRRWAEPVAGGSVVVATSAASFDMASFVSVEFLHMNGGSSSWLVAYGANTADHQTYVCAASRVGVRFTRQVVSDFAQQHFVRGGAYFYALPVTSTGLTRQMNVVGYLPEFERSPKNESRVFHAYAAFMPGERAVFKTLPARRFAGSAHATAVDESQYAALFGAVNETASTLALFDNRSGVVQRVGLPAALDEQHVQDSSQTMQTMPTMRRLLEHNANADDFYPQFSLSCPAGQYADWSAQWGNMVSGRQCASSAHVFDYDPYSHTPYGFFEHMQQSCEHATGCYGIACRYVSSNGWPDNYDPDWIDRCYTCYKTGAVLSPPPTNVAWVYQGWILNRASTQCVECPTQSSSPAGSNHLEDCTCNSGYEGPDGGPCPAPPASSGNCVSGQYKVETTENVYGTTRINRRCQFSGDHRYYNGPASGYINQPGLTRDFCRTKCIEWTDCTAVAFVDGYTSVGLESCDLCPPAFITTSNTVLAGSPAGSRDTYTAQLLTRSEVVLCEDCPAYSSAPAGSTVSTDCVCNAGFDGPAGGPCECDVDGCMGCDGVPYSGKVLDVCGVCDGDSSCAGCDGVANSGKVLDACGVCDGDNSCFGCDGVPNSGKTNDVCGVCDGDGTSCAGCDGVANSGKVLDVCGVCDGDSSCAGCDGVANSGKTNDVCGVCDGDGTSCAGCDGVANSGKTNDVCGVCGGDNTTCDGCDGVAGSGKVNDNCGVCDGDGTSCAGCDGVAGSGKVLDVCGVCDGGDSSLFGECCVEYEVHGNYQFCDYNDNIGGTRHGLSFAECQAACSNLPNCLSWTWHLYRPYHSLECHLCSDTRLTNTDVYTNTQTYKKECHSPSAEGCDGVANSGKTNDVCGVCDGDGTSCAGCDGVANSGKTNDVCGVCDGDASCIEYRLLAAGQTCDGATEVGQMHDSQCAASCTAMLDCSGYSIHWPKGASPTCYWCQSVSSLVQDGSSSVHEKYNSLEGCDGVVGSGKVLDLCDVCDGDSTSCAGCDGVANSGKTNDVCGVCDGDASCIEYRQIASGQSCDGATAVGPVTDPTAEGSVQCAANCSAMLDCSGYSVYWPPAPSPDETLSCSSDPPLDSVSAKIITGPTQGTLRSDGTYYFNIHDYLVISTMCHHGESAADDAEVEYSMVPLTNVSMSFYNLAWSFLHRREDMSNSNGCLSEIMRIWPPNQGIGVGGADYLTFPGHTYQVNVKCSVPSRGKSYSTSVNFTVNNPPEGPRCTLCRYPRFREPDCMCQCEDFADNRGCTSASECESRCPNDVCEPGCEMTSDCQTYGTGGIHVFRYTCENWTDDDQPLEYQFEYDEDSVVDDKTIFAWGPSHFVDIVFPSASTQAGDTYHVYAKVRDAFGQEQDVRSNSYSFTRITVDRSDDAMVPEVPTPWIESPTSPTCYWCQNVSSLVPSSSFITYEKYNSLEGCDGVVNSGKVLDLCDVCDGDNACVGCDGVVNSGKVLDLCGVCDGDNLCMGCDGVPYGKSEDPCGVCGGDGNSCRGCDGVQNSGAVLDVCGVCGGNESTCRDCDGVPNSGKKPDRCGVCDGDNSTCAGCDGVPNSGKTNDTCGVCHGDNSTCAGCDGVPNSGLELDDCGVCGGNNAECCPPNQYWQFAEREWSEISPDWGTTCASVAKQIETYALFVEQGVPLTRSQTLGYCQDLCDRLEDCKMIWFDGFNSPFSCFICEGNATSITYGKYDFTFKPVNVIQNQGCRDCPSDSSSPSGSKSITDCACNENFAGPGGGPCVPLNIGCDGAVNSGKTNDVCGVCDGDGTSCDGCDGVANSGLVVDICDVCGGDNSSCAPLPPQDPRRQLSLKPVAFSTSDADRVWVLDFELQCGASVENSFGEATWGRWQHECTGADTDTANVVMVAKYVRDAREASGPAGLMARAYYTHSAGCEAGSDSAATRVEQNCSLSRLHNASAVAAAVRVWPADADRRASALAELYVTQISMSGGAQLVSAQEMAEEPTWHEMAATLQEDMSTSDTLETAIRGKQRATRPVAVRPAWQRVRRLFDGGALRSGFGGLFEDGVRLDVHVQRPADDVESELMVGVDDVQVSPVLTRHPELLSERNSRLGLETVLYVPTAEELGQIGLAHLLRGRDDETLADELNGAGHHWARIHVTVGVEAHLQMAGCEVEIKLMDLTADGAVSDAFAAPTGTLGRVGCFLRMTRLQAGSEDSEDSDDVEDPAGTVYDECQVEVPVDAAHDYTHQQVGLRAEIRTAATADPSVCSVQDASLVGYLRAHTALYECPAEHFYAYDEGRCVHCHAELDAAHVQSCSAGTRLRGCPALERARVCVDCVHGASLVASQRAHWLPNVPGVVCNWACDAEYYYSEFEATCVVCTNRTTCQVGQRWQPCTNTTDAQCVSCPNLRAVKGRFGDNEEYVASDVEDVEEECQTACKEGHFRSEDGLCRRCSTLADVLELALSDGAGFYRFSACNESSDAVAHVCDAVEGSEATAHAGDFGLDCPRTCAAGWYQTADGCEQCVWPRQVPLNDTQAVQTIFQPPYPEAWEAVDTTDTMIGNPVCCEGTTQTCEGPIDPGSVVINTDASENSPFIPAYGPRTMRITWSDVHWQITRYNIMLMVVSQTASTQMWIYSAVAMSGPEATLAIGEHNKHKFLPVNDVTMATGFASFPGFEVLDAGSNAYRIFLQRFHCDGSIVAGGAEQLSDYADAMRPADAPKNPRHTVKDGHLHVMWDRVPSAGRGLGDPPPNTRFTYFGYVFEVRHGEYTYYYDCPFLPPNSADRDQSLRDGVPVNATSALDTSATLQVRCFNAYDRAQGFWPDLDNVDKVELAIAPVNANIAVRTAAKTHCCVGPWTNWTSLHYDTNAASNTSTAVLNPLFQPPLQYGSAGLLDDATSCALHCSPGLFRLLPTDTCRPHSNLTCASDSYKQAGTPHTDTQCRPCTGCEGQNLLSTCTVHRDDLCAPCDATQFADFDVHSERWVGTSCERECVDGFVRNKRTSLCEGCSHRCAPGGFFAADRSNCTHCTACAAKPTHAVWDTRSDRADCVWQCDLQYQLINNDCERKDAVFNLDLIGVNRDLECAPGDTLYNFACMSCYEAPHISAQDLPLSEQLHKTWDWTFECSWSCYHTLDLLALKARSGTHWECVHASHWQRAMAGEQVNSAWSAADALGTTADVPESALRNSSHDLIIAGIALAGVPLLLLLIMVIVHLVLRCTKQNKLNASEKPAARDSSHVGHTGSSVTLHIADQPNTFV